MARRKKFDPTKNRKLDEFLNTLQIEREKKAQIMEFVENLTFEQIKAVGVKKRKLELRLKR